jgi:hypothetical protein
MRRCRSHAEPQRDCLRVPRRVIGGVRARGRPRWPAALPPEPVDEEPRVVVDQSCAHGSRGAIGSRFQLGSLSLLADSSTQLC